MLDCRKRKENDDTTVAQSNIKYTISYQMMVQFYAYLHISSHLSELVPTKENKRYKMFYMS